MNKKPEKSGWNHFGRNKKKAQSMDEMNNEWSPKVLTVCIAVGAAVVRLIMDARHITFLAVLRAVFVAAFVAYLVGEGLAEVDLSSGTKNAIVGVASLLSRELVEGLIQLADQWQRNPKAFIDSIRKGGK
ncbi:phage holin family protein [Endozoicomonas euniceicola]|uniref:Phage holin family protein n=1 Tax=Endozoicomonas euniceicola TaxID=1234143 RepID=A0ABY6GNF9_9GAMM|nr:phage holin family protein [Endozoicomonas euniceicola]UYM14272.1 phage holin family protein [Endozoicomonas euniceicola]